MNKGIIIGVGIAIIIGAIAVTVSSYDSASTSDIPLDEEISEVPLDEEIKSEPKQFSVEIRESIGFSGG